MKNTIFFALIFSCQILTSQPLTGYNAPWLFNQFKSGYPDTATIAQVKALSPDIIRFPGGTSSFYYATDRPAYGYSGDTRPNYAAAHVRFCNEVKAQTSYVANLYQPMIDPASEAYWIADIVKAVKILNPAYVELGNELYLYPEINGGYRNGEPNIFQKRTFAANVTAAAIRDADLCRKVMAAVNSAGYYPQFGVVIDAPFHTRGRAWNAAIRTTSLPYHAEIFHVYTLQKTYAGLRDEIARFIAGAEHQVWVTEYWYNFGFNCDKNLGAISEPFYPNLAGWFDRAFSELGVDIALRHQLYGVSEYCVIRK